MIYKNTEQLSQWLKKSKHPLWNEAEFELNADEYAKHFKDLKTRPASEREDAAAFRCMPWEEPSRAPSPAVQPYPSPDRSDRKVLTAMAESEGYFFNFAALTCETRMDRREVRRIVRHLARRGLTEYAKGLWNEDGEPCGAGYRITNAGMDALVGGSNDPG